MELNTIINADCLEYMKTLPDKCIDLIIADPDYLIKNTKAGGNSKLSKSMQNMNNELVRDSLVSNSSCEWCYEVPRLQEKINIFIWCNKAQIIMYLDYFVKQLGCSWQDFQWRKTNAMPTFNNKSLTDKEYCLYFRKGGYFNPKCYEDAKTIWDEPINIIDKNKFGHPTIKPEKIIKTIIRNASKEGQLILDPYSGSGTVAKCCHDLKRNFIACEILPKYHKLGLERLENAKAQLTLDIPATL